MNNLQKAVSLKALLENPELLNPPIYKGDDKKDQDGGDMYPSQSAYLVPNLWDKTLPYGGNDFKLEFMDLDEFLNENTVTPPSINKDMHDSQHSPQMAPMMGQLSPQSPQEGSLLDIGGAPMGGQSMVVPAHSPAGICLSSLPSPGSPTGSVPPSSPHGGDVKVDINLTTSDVLLSTVPGEDSYDPTRRHFSEEELRPQPMIKKSRKIYVPDDLKDDKYWKRRQKNNTAAKRSRDARRIKENQIALRAHYLEQENGQLKDELEKSRRDNKQLKKQLSQLDGTAAE